MRGDWRSRLLAGVLLLAVTGCGGDSEIINGAGASFPTPFYTAAFEEVFLERGIRVSYQSTSSSRGQELFIQRKVAFGATDTPMSEKEERRAGGDPRHIATVGGAVVASYNLEGVDTLNLTGDVLADIFLGNITNWNDPAIAELNPDTNLPDEPIEVVHRSDGAGTTTILTNYLAAVSPEWESGPGAGDELDWPVGTGAAGNEGVAGRIQLTPDSIGYVAYEYAVENGLDFASIGEEAGNFVEPSVQSARAAIQAANIPEDPKTIVSSTNPQGEGVYPITGLTWILVRQQMDDLAECRAVAKMVWYVTHDAQSMAPDLNYVQMPDDVISINEELIRSMQAEGRSCYEG